MWTANNSLAWDLVFIPNESQIAESHVMHDKLYLRDAKQGNIVGQLQAENCGGGWYAITVPSKNMVLVADTNRFIGLNADHLAIISQWDLGTGQCQDLVRYYGSFNIFDVNSEGNLLAYGGEGKENTVVIWDIDTQKEICHTGEVDFGRFLPQQNILAVIRGQQMIFLDALSCTKLRELPVSTDGTYLAFSPDGQQVAVAEDSIQIRDISTEKILTQIPYPQNTVLYDLLLPSGLEFSPDGHYLLIAYLTTDRYGGKIQLWQVQ